MPDAFPPNHLPYLDEINRASTVCFSIQNAIRLYHKTFFYQYSEELKVESALSTRISPGPYLIQFTKEKQLDDFLIGTFFEIIAKAFLLNEGLIIHKISTRGVPREVKSLANNQSTAPVSVTRYLEYDNFADHKNTGINHLRYLAERTLDYKWLYNESYAQKLPFSKDFQNTARTFRDLRNEIHFPTAGTSEPIANLDPIPADYLLTTISDEVNRTIRPLFDSLSHRYSLCLEPLTTQQ